jgi:hypothetical protein
MKKESGFKLRSGNKPSPAKFFRRFLKSANPARGLNRAGKTFKGLLRGEKSGGGAMSRNMGAASMLGGSSMGALGMLGGRRRRRGGSPNMAARVAGALGMRNRQIPGKPVGPNRGGFLGAIRPIAGKALVRRR